MMNNHKTHIREELLRRRNSLPAVLRTKYSRMIADALITTPEFTVAKVIHTYLSFGSEVETDLIRMIGFSHNKRIAVPVMNQDNPLLLHSFITNNQRFTTAKWNIPTPLSPIIESDFKLSEHDIIIVPLVGFDRSKQRLGYGKGYYDRFLSYQLALKIGIAFSIQEVDQIPIEPHDHRLSMIITEQDIIR